MNKSGTPSQGHEDKRRAIEQGKRAQSPAEKKSVNLEKIRRHVLELSGDAERQYDELLRHIGEAEVVMIGEATHGTHEFYEERARITKRLVEEKVTGYLICLHLRCACILRVLRKSETTEGVSKPFYMPNFVTSLCIRSLTQESDIIGVALFGSWLWRFKGSSQNHT